MSARLRLQSENEKNYEKEWPMMPENTAHPSQTPAGMNLSFLGGAMEVGASCILLEIAGWKILMDCGIRQKTGKDTLPDLRRIQEEGGVDCILVSHAHMDHTGSLPIISAEYPFAPIYMTPMTMDLSRVLLYDSIKLMQHAEDGIPLYAEKQVLDMLDRVRPVRFGEPLEILPEVTLTMYPAGHIAGAACIYLQTPAGSLFYSGDFSSFAQNTIEGAMVPRLRPDVSILESTYGDRLHANREIEEDRLLEIVRECAERRGKMLIPAFALGRAQEVLLILKRGMAKGAIPKIKVYADGMVRQICGVYERYPEFLKRNLAKQAQKGKPLFWTDEIQPVPLNADRKELLNTAEPEIFVSSSGMLTGGPSVEYASRIAPMENGYIVITGYQDEEAPGRQIQNLMSAAPGTDRILRLDGKPVPVACRLCQVGLSAHGDRSEIQGLAQRLDSRDLFLVHGDPEVIPVLASSLDLSYRTRIYAPKDGEKFDIVLRSPRKQWKKEFPYTLQQDADLWEIEDPGQREALEQHFREYLLAHYPNQRFSLPELAFVYYGKTITDEGTLAAFQKAVQESLYFSTDRRRLFLYVPASDEDLAEAKKKTALTQQDLADAAAELFAGIPVRKFGYYMGQKKITLTLDFPKPYQEALQEPIKAFQARTGCTVEVSQQPNEHAMQEFLQKELGNAVQKISINKSQQCVTVKLVSNPDPETLAALKKQWEEMTGYGLAFTGVLNEGAGGGTVTAAGENEFDRAGSEPMEQNAAFQRIRDRFAGRQDVPYKFGLSSDQHGQCIRLFFLSPAQGRRNAELLNALSEEIGWRLVIADSVNQNALMAAARAAMEDNGIAFCKNPSWQPGRGVLQVQVNPEVSEETFAAFAREVEEKTAVPVERKL